MKHAQKLLENLITFSTSFDFPRWQDINLYIISTSFHFPPWQDIKLYPFLPHLTFHHDRTSNCTTFCTSLNFLPWQDIKLYNISTSFDFPPWQDIKWYNNFYLIRLSTLVEHQTAPHYVPHETFHPGRTSNCITLCTSLDFPPWQDIKLHNILYLIRLSTLVGHQTVQNCVLHQTFHLGRISNCTTFCASQIGRAHV